MDNKDEIEMCDIVEKSDGSEDETSKSNRKKNTAKKRDPIQCPCCIKTFVKTYDFKVHMHTHTGLKLPKNFQCNVCDKTFLANNLLKRHLSSHLGKDRERRHACKDCGKAYTQLFTLREHELKHHGKGEKKFKCAECDAVFYRKSEQKRHFKLHTGVKDYTCHVCMKGFNQKCNLDRHLKVHIIDDRKYECTECHRRYISRSSLVKHCRRHKKKKDEKKIKKKEAD